MLALIKSKCSNNEALMDHQGPPSQLSGPILSELGLSSLTHMPFLCMSYVPQPTYTGQCISFSK